MISTLKNNPTTMKKINFSQAKQLIEEEETKKDEKIEEKVNLTEEKTEETKKERKELKEKDKFK